MTTNNTKESPKPRCVTVDMTAITPTTTRWLWQNKIAYKNLNLFYGDGENAKSLTTLDIAARGSRGLPMPGESVPQPPFTTIIITTEDALEEVIAPRYKAAGGDPCKLHHVIEVTGSDGKSHPFHLVKSIEALAETIKELGDVGLIVVDPVDEFTSGYDLHRNAETKQALAPIDSLAKSLNVAVVLVAHINKNSGQTAKHRVNASVALINRCRSAYLFVEDKSDAEKYLMLRGKGNLQKRGGSTGLAFRLQDIEGHPRINWLDESVYVTTDEALAIEPSGSQKISKLEEAKRFLFLELKDKPVSARAISKHAKDAGIKESTLQRAYREMSIKSRKSKKTGKVYWQLDFPAKKAG